MVAISVAALWMRVRAERAVWRAETMVVGEVIVRSRWKR